jgi:hypothetical protein
MAPRNDIIAQKKTTVQKCTVAKDTAMTASGQQAHSEKGICCDYGQGSIEPWNAPPFSGIFLQGQFTSGARQCQGTTANRFFNVL